jgi:serine/threonine protein kinase
MKLIKGTTLWDLLAARPDSATDRERFVVVFEQVCQAIAYAHVRAVIHRDLKPQNVMIGGFGEVQVMDWGLAKVLADPALPLSPAAGSRPGVFGTPAYMPPEQARGAVEEMDRRSDVFTLGGILCAILTGQPPYVGTDAESTRQRAAVADVSDCFARLDRCGAEPELVALARRCLSPNPADRPPHAGAVASGIAAYRAAAAERAREAVANQLTVERRQLRRARRALAITVVALVAALTALVWCTTRAGENAHGTGTESVVSGFAR